MWYIQIDRHVPQKIHPVAQSKSSAIKWQYHIKEPDKLDILYIFHQADTIQGAYSVRITVGSAEFYLGSINHNVAALQSEPNFPIESGTKCFVTIQQEANETVPFKAN